MLRLRLSAMVLSMLFTVSVYAQDVWEWQNPLPLGHDLLSVSFSMSNIGIGVGKYGAIVRTLDGGSTWEVVDSGTTNQLNGTAFPSSDYGYAVGFSGTVLMGSSSAGTWTPQVSGTTQNLFDVFFIDNSTGWAVGVGGTIIHTTDSGANWTTQTSGTTQVLYGVSFIDANTGWVVGNNGEIFSTTNGGATWTPQTSGITQKLNDVTFADANNGWAVGYLGRILHTTDGGSNWNIQTSGTGAELYDVSFYDANTAWIVGEDVIFYTTDAGSNWNSQTIPDISGLSSKKYIKGVAAVDANTVYAVANKGIMLNTTDAGSNWIAQSSGERPNLFSISFPDDNTGWAVGDDGGQNSWIIHTSDGGSSWTLQDSINSGVDTGLLGLVMINTSTGWAVGRTGTILHTTDGTNWNAQTSGTTSSLYSVSFVDANNGWTCGMNGEMVHSTDGGSTWNTQVSGTSVHLMDISFCDANTGWAVGYTGTILHTSDGGATWTSQVSGVTKTLFGVMAVDAETAWAVGGTGTLLHTVDGGANWSSIASGSTYTLYEANFITPSVGWIVGTGGRVHYTNDGGTSWNMQDNGLTDDSLKDIAISGTGSIWIAGVAGSIIHSASGGFITADVSLPAFSYDSAGDTVRIPVTIANLDSDVGFMGMEFSLLYEDSILNFVDIDTTGYLVGGFSVDTATVLTGSGPDTLNFTAAHITPAVSDGNLVDLIFVVDGASSLGDTTTLTLDTFILNEGIPTINMHDGFFKNAQDHLLGDSDFDGSINAVDASVVLQAAVHKITPDSLQSVRMDVSGNGNVHAFDAAMILQKVAGLITSFPAGSAFVAPKPAVVNDGAIVALNLAEEANGVLAVTINLDNIASASGADLTLEYDAGQYRFIGHAATGLTEAFIFESNVADEGVLHVGMAAAAPIEQSGDLVTLKFQRLNENGGEANFRLTRLYLNEYELLGGIALNSSATIPLTYALAQNYPNPFNPGTTVQYEIPEDAQVRIDVYDILGRQVIQLVSAPHEAGRYTAMWNGLNSQGQHVASGIYIYRMTANNFVRTRKMLLLK